MKKTVIYTIIFSFCTMALAFAFAWREITNRERKIFDYESTQIVTLLSEHLSAANHLSANYQSLFHASDFIDADEFRIFSEDALANCPTIKNAAYCPRVKAKNLEKFIEEKRYWGILKFDVFKLDDQQNKISIDAGKECYPIIYCEPYIPENVYYLGCDIKSLDDISNVFQDAILSGKPEQYFGNRVLFNGKDDFMIIVPVYEGKQWPKTPDERSKNNNGMIILIVDSNKLLYENNVPDGISVSLIPELNNLNTSSLPILNINDSDDTQKYGSVRLKSEYEVSVQSQNFKISINKNIKISNLNLWPLTLASCIATALSASIFFILKNRFELAQELVLRTKTQDELIKYKDHLEDTVKERTKELSDKNLILQNEICIRENAEKELKSTTSQLIQTEKLATIGQIAAGVAHEVNTPLGAIGSTNSTIQKVFEELMDCLKDHPDIIASNKLVAKLIDRIYTANSNLSSREIRKYKSEIIENISKHNIKNIDSIALFLTNTGIVSDYEVFIPLFQMDNSDKIISFIQKTAAIVNGCRIIDSAVNQSSRVVLALKDYARSEELHEMTDSNIRESINTAVLLWKNKIKHGIDLKVEFDEVANVLCHSHELCQVWTNLIQNAIHAMNNSGKLTITLKQHNDKIKVKISDTGPGIPDDIQDKIFEPLFTTKDKGEGTGLGLDISKRIIERHNGNISFTTSAKGTIFTVTLPASKYQNTNNISADTDNDNDNIVSAGLQT